MMKAEEFARQQLNNSPVYDYKVIAKLLQDFHSQFKPSDEEIKEETEKRYKDIWGDMRSEGYAFNKGAKWMRDKIFKAEI